MTLYIIQAEESSGIPGFPELYTDQVEADLAYKEAWADALEVDIDKGEDTYTREQFEKDYTGTDFESDFWPPDGGVRMWALTDDELPEKLRPLPGDVVSTLQEAVDAAINSLDGMVEAGLDDDGEARATIDSFEIASTALAQKYGA